MQHHKPANKNIIEGVKTNSPVAASMHSHIANSSEFTVPWPPWMRITTGNCFLSASLLPSVATLKGNCLVHSARSAMWRADISFTNAVALFWHHFMPVTTKSVWVGWWRGVIKIDKEREKKSSIRTYHGSSSCFHTHDHWSIKNMITIVVTLSLCQASKRTMLKNNSTPTTLEKASGPRSSLYVMWRDRQTERIVKLLLTSCNF